MEAGFSKIDITPNLPVSTLYTRNPEQMAHKIGSRLFSRISVFQYLRETVVLMCTDLLGLDSGFTDKIKIKLQEKGFKPENVLIACTHTHTAPSTLNFNGGNDLIKKESKYLRQLEMSILNGVSEAVKNLEPIEIISAKTKVDLNVNRREIGRMSDINDLNAPTGLVDDDLGIIFINHKRTGKRSAILNYTAHPLAMGKESVGSISADYPGEICRILEEKGYSFVQFFQGAAGNINVKISGGIKTCKKAGKILADAVFKVGNCKGVYDSQILEVKTAKLQMPVDNLQKLLDRKNTEDVPVEVEHEWREKAIKKDKNAKNVSILIQYLQIGNTKIFAIPGEQFVETGLALKKGANCRSCFVVAYANCGEIGYVPTKKAFSEGGYEVDTAYKYYGDIVYRSSPEASDYFIEKSLELMIK